VYYGYFPRRFREKYDITTIQHPLKKEIVGTCLVNRMINQAGTTLLPEIFSILDTNVVDVLVGYTVLDQVFKLGEIRYRIMTELKTRNINTAYTLKIKLENFIRDVLIWMIISYNSTGLKFSLINDFITTVAEFKKEIETNMYPDELDQFQNTVENLMTLGISSDLAKDIARLDSMKDCLEIILQAMKGNISLVDAISLAKGADSMFHFQVLYNRIMGIELDSIWMRKHRGLLLKQLQALKHKAFITIAERYQLEEDFDDRLAQFMEDNKQGFKKYQIEFNQIVNTEFVELSGVAILLDAIDILLK
ncbi:NAD-glutamate dehydrogenase, partial [bacterium]|nr:NAD-glutamate dehydrogenase [bacterium]